jgi:hypothetical protein
MRKTITTQWLATLFTLFEAVSSASAQPAKIAIGYRAMSADQRVIWVAKDPRGFAKNNDARFVEEFDKSGYIDSLYGRKKLNRVEDLVTV